MVPWLNKFPPIVVAWPVKLLVILDPWLIILPNWLDKLLAIFVPWPTKLLPIALAWPVTLFKLFVPWPTILVVISLVWVFKLLNLLAPWLTTLLPFSTILFLILFALAPAAVAIPTHWAINSGLNFKPNISNIPFGVKKSIIHLKDKNSAILTGKVNGLVKLLKKSIMYLTTSAITFIGKVTKLNISFNIGCAFDAKSNNLDFISFNLVLSDSSLGFFLIASSNFSLANKTSSGLSLLSNSSTSFNNCSLSCVI